MNLQDCKANFLYDKHYVISESPPIFMKIGNLVYFRVLITNIAIIFRAKAGLTPIWSKNRM
jgi:hypothetical protein